MQKILTIIGGVIIAVLSFLFGNEKRKREKTEIELSEAVEELAVKEVEITAEKTAGDHESETSELMKEVDEKVNEAIKEIHESVNKSQSEIYNIKINGWNKIKR